MNAAETMPTAELPTKRRCMIERATMTFAHFIESSLHKNDLGRGFCRSIAKEISLLWNFVEQEEMA